MIDFYSGTPGSGKSLHTIKVIKDHIEKKGLPVVGNFYFKASALKNRDWGSYLYVDNDHLTPKLLYDFSMEYQRKRRKHKFQEDEILLVIDECQLIYNARQWNKKGMKEWIAFYTQHRKLFYHVILVAQFKNMIDRQIRSVIEYEYLHRKVKNIGIYGKIINLFTGGNLHICVKMYAPLSMRVSSEWFRADRGLYKLYDSFRLFDASVPPEGQGCVR